MAEIVRFPFSTGRARISSASGAAAVVLVDRTLRILALSHGAEAMLVDVAVACEGAPFRFLSRTDQRALATAVAAHAGNAGTAESCFGVGSAEWGRPRFACFVKSLAATGDAVAQVELCSVDPGVVAPERSLELVFGLTPAEARLAAEIVRSGMLKAAAAKLRISVNTAKTQAAAALAKTGAGNQVELARIVVNLDRHRRHPTG